MVMSNDLALALGLFHTDGCLGINRSKRKLANGGYNIHEYWYFNFGSTDRYLTEYFKKIFKVPNNIIVTNDNRKDSYKTIYRVNTHNKELTTYIKSLGYSERKQLDLPKLLKAIEGYEESFIQGVLEGDGSVCVSNGCVDIVCPDENVADWLYAFMQPKIKVYRYILKRKNCDLHLIRFKDAKTFYNIVFKFKPCFMSRKHKALLDLIASRNSQFSIVNG